MPKSVAKDVALRLGLLSTTVTLMPMHNTEDERETKTFLITPCEHHSRVEQFYRSKDCSCTPDGEPKGYKTGELMKGTTVEGKTHVLTAEEVAEVCSSDMEKNVLDVMVTDAAEFEAQMWPSGNSYWIEPNRMDPAFAALCVLAQDETLALYGKMRLRSEGAYRLVLGAEGGLVVQQYLRPNETYHYDARPVEISEKEEAMARMFAETVKEGFDPEAMSSKTVERMRELVASKTGEEGATVTPISKKAVTKDESLESALEMALAAAKAAKAS